MFLQIDSSAVVEMEIIDSDESDYDFSSEPPSHLEAGMYFSMNKVCRKQMQLNRFWRSIKAVFGWMLGPRHITYLLTIHIISHGEECR